MRDHSSEDTDYPLAGVICQALFHEALDGAAYCEMLSENGKADFRFIAANSAFLGLIGLEDISGKLASDIASGLIDAGTRRRLDQAARAGKPERFETYVESLGEWFLISAYGTRHDRFVAVFQPVTEYKQSERDLQLAGMVFQDTSEAIMIADANNVIVTVNPAFERITGYSADELVGRHTDMLESGLQGEEEPQSIAQAVDASGYWKGELWSRRKNGERLVASVIINTHYDPRGAVYRRIVLFSDITEIKRSEELLWRQANYDALTGLPNRQLFREHLGQQIRKARSDRQPLVLMYLDLDGFKDINDTLGLRMGDLLLKKAAERLSGCARQADNVARFGGDEFMMIMTGLHDVYEIDHAARQILKHLAEPVRLDNGVAYMSASIGISLYPGDATEIDDLIRNADQAMHAAKREGKNRYHFFTPALQEAAVGRIRLVNDMRTALDSNQFEIVFQPIVELSSGAIHKAEALIRWQHPERGVINPFEFISAAEDTGMIIAFGDWIFRESAGKAAQWRQHHQPDFQISINVSPVQLRNEGIDSTVWFDHLRQLGLPGQGIVVEITEGLLLDATEQVTSQLLRLRDAGIQVALDDFGTGYSSLAYLQKFDIDYIKMDRAFVRNLTAESTDMALCEAIIVMAHKLGLKVIAEGIETAEQRRFLLEAGCDYGQGYLFSRPVTAGEMEHLLKQRPVG